MRKYFFITTAVFAALIIALTSCKHTTESSSFHDYIDPANMDLSVAPGDDYFSYANGTWIKNTPIPASEVWWGTAKISENDNFKKIKAMLEEAASSSPSDKMEKMVGDMYKSGMDTTAIDKLGISPIKADLDRIATIKNTDDLFAEIALNQTMGVPNTFGFGAGSDLKNSSEVVAYFGQGGLGLPEKGYYFNTDADTKKIRAAYVQYITNMLSYTGEAGKQMPG